MENWFELEFLLLKIIRLQPSELDRMEFYRAEFLIDNLKKHSEEENKNRKKEEEKYNESTLKQPNPSKLMADAKKSLPSTFAKMPSSFKF